MIDEINELFRLRLLTPYGYGKQFEHLGRILACFNDLNTMTPELLKDVLSNYKIEMKQGPEEFAEQMIQNMNAMFIKFMDRDKEESNECSRLIHYANEHALYGCPVRDIILEQFEIGKDKYMRQLLTFVLCYNMVSDMKHIMTE